MLCPYTREHLLLVPALNPNVALIHVQRCDEFGNAQIDGLPFMDIDLAMAADRVILTTERIVSNEQIRRAPDHTKIPFFAVDGVVELPFGCAPHECSGVYEPMMRHMEYYVGLVNHYHVYGPRYRSWAAHDGYRYRSYRASPGYHYYRGYRQAAPPARYPAHPSVRRR